MKFPENVLCWIIYLSLKKAIEGFNIVEFHDYCGQTITREAGHVLFNAQKIRDNQCSVTISGQMTSSFPYYIMFYFTMFNLTADSCKDSNLLVTDDRYGFTSSGMLGLPEHLCGHNQTLAGTYFTTSTEILRLTFRRKDAMENLTGEFSLKFIVFHKGTCDTKKEFKCPNQQCVAKQLHCGGEVNACGADEENSCKPTKVKNTEEYTIFETLSSFIPLVVIVAVGLPIKFKDKIRNFCGCPKNRAVPATSSQANENHVENGLHTSHGTVSHNVLNHSPYVPGTNMDYGTTSNSFVNVNVDCIAEHDRKSSRGHIEDVNILTCPVAISHDVGYVDDVNRESSKRTITPDPPPVEDHDIEANKESFIHDLHLHGDHDVVVGRDCTNNGYAEDDCFDPPLEPFPSTPLTFPSSDINLTVLPPGEDILNNRH